MLTLQKLRFVGLAGFATVGKDLFFSTLNKEYPAVRFSLADTLKEEVRHKILEEQSIDILNCSKEDKEAVRPALVDYGTKKRKETQGRYFMDKLQAKINNSFTDSKIPVITDIRYAEYENDEVSWLKNDLKGVLVYIKKYEMVAGQKIYVEAPNKDEEKNDPSLRKKADYVVDWETVSGDHYEKQKHLAPHIKKFIDWYSKVL